MAEPPRMFTAYSGWNGISAVLRPRKASIPTICSTTTSKRQYTILSTKLPIYVSSFFHSRLSSLDIPSKVPAAMASSKSSTASQVVLQKGTLLLL